MGVIKNRDQKAQFIGREKRCIGVESWLGRFKNEIAVKAFDIGAAAYGAAVQRVERNGCCPVAADGLIRK